MKFTKERFKTIAKSIGAFAFVVAFGVGHLIASNDLDHVDNSPVITVPVVKADNVLSPTDVTDDGLGYATIEYSFTTSYVWRSVTYNLGSTIQFYLLNGDLYLNATHIYYDLLTLEQKIWTNDLNLGAYSNYTYDITLNLSYRMDIPQIDNDWNFQISTVCYVQNQVNNLLCNNYYNYDVISGYFEPTSYVNDYISKEFFQFIFVTYPTLPSTYRQQGIDYVLSHLSEYNLYTSEQYLQYGQDQYNLGLNNSANVLSVSGMIREIFRAPISMFQNAFNFTLPLPDGTSLNVGGILTFFLTIGIALTIVSLISKIGGH